MGPRDNSSLPEGPFPVGGHSDRLAGRREYGGEASEEQAKTHHLRPRGKAFQGTQGSQIRRVLSPYIERIKERFRRGNIGGARTSRNKTEEEVPTSLIFIQPQGAVGH